MIKLKPMFVILLSSLLVVARSTSSFAIDAPPAPTQPPAPTMPSTPTQPPAPTQPPVPTQPPLPTQPPAPTASTTPAPSPAPTSFPQSTPTPSSTSTPTQPPAPTPLGDNTGNQNRDGNVGDTSINTGDGVTSATINNSGNTNTTSVATGSSDGVGLVNSGNGTSSDNSTSAKILDNTQLNQTNTAVVNNDLSLQTNTGNNSANKNVGGDSSISTGDANTTATVVNSLNTNLLGATTAEFNVVDDQKGDLILDFAAGCTSGCSALGDTTISNTDNGANSTNIAAIDSVAETTTFQQNDATVENNLTLGSNSGSNTADSNTKGNNSIDTGDANTSASVLNFVNNNLAGNVLYGVVNIFGNLVGDIVLPENYASAPDSGTGTQTQAANTGNGADSTNTAAIAQTSTDETFQTNSADIENNLLLTSTTGSNQASANTGGDTSIDSGDTKAQASVLNVANTNVEGGTWWLAIVNEAGRWVGKILGAPDDANMAGSAGTEFIVNDTGEVVAINHGNGAGSTNTSSINQTTANTTTQTNNTKIVNNLNLSANTGGNSTSRNTNGDNSIKTGDATVIASIVNFVNNNIKTNGRIVVTVVNVFGSWIGDFVTPGSHKETTLAIATPTPTPSPAIGGIQSENPVENIVADESPQDDSNNTTTTIIRRRRTAITTQATTLAQALPTTTTIHRLPAVLPAMDSLASIDDAITLTPVPSAKPFELNLAWLMLLLPPTSLWAIAKNRAFLASLLLSLVTRTQL